MAGVAQKEEQRGRSQTGLSQPEPQGERVNWRVGDRQRSEASPSYRAGCAPNSWVAKRGADWPHRSLTRAPSPVR